MDWSTATRATYAAPVRHERAVPVKPSPGSNLSFGTAAVDYKSTTGAAYVGGTVERGDSAQSGRREASKGDPPPVVVAPLRL